MTEEKEKQGLMVGFITEGMVPAKWMMRLNEMSGGIPSGVFWKYCWYEGKEYREKGGYAKARTKVVEQARAHKAKWLFFIDTDVFPPPDVITRLMSHNKPIVTGIYYMKGYPPQPVIFKKIGDGPYWDYPVEELVEIGGSGLGCTLIDMDVFDKFEEAGIPFFDENWIHTKPDGSRVKVKVGEDHWFFQKASELGYKIYCDTSCLCDHMDFKNGAIFPGEDEVKKIREKILRKKGEGDIIDREKKLFDVDPKKKTIVFYNPLSSKFSGDELERRGVGGAETAVINLAKNLAKHFNVVVFCDCPRQGIFDGVRYLHISDTEFMKKFKTDLLVISRKTDILANVDFKDHFKVDKVCLWAHDIPDSPVFDSLPKAIKNIDKIFVLSNWHKEVIKRKFPIVPDDKFYVTRNGIDPELFKEEIERNPKKLIYSSTPFRGLNTLLEVFPKIQEFVPEVELHIFSSMKVYGLDTSEEKEWLDLYEKADRMDGVSYHSTVTQRELAKHMKSSSLLAYPNNYPETFCITAIEAVAAGTPIVTSKFAALPEVVPKGCGILIDGDPNSEQYKKEFIDRVVGILNHGALWEEMHKACKRVDVDSISWKSVSKDWVKDFLPKEYEAYCKAVDEKPVLNMGKAEKKARKNINTPEYWDKQYKYEDAKGIDQRTDVRRWNKILEQVNDGDVILDYGCARGEFLSYAKKQKPDCQVYGVDFSNYAISRGMKRDSDLILVDDIKKFSDKKFDVITAQHVIEHFDDPVEFVAGMRKHLNDDGTLILVFPLNDEWIEHVTVWQMGDVLELLDRFPCTYKLNHRKLTIRKAADNKNYVEEIIAFIKFKNN